jgi:uncharacterized protein YdeI (YjbR/CyaY-like superfamily)
MGKKDKRVDAYIEKAGDFAKPILRHIRKLVHTVCPEVEETFKWSQPAFMYRGILCISSAFKQHCALVFWQKSVRKSLAAAVGKQDWGGMHKIASMADMPKDSVLTQAIKESMKLNESGVAGGPAQSAKKKPLVIPAFVKKALNSNKTAKEVFAGLSPSHQREYVEWVVGAKREETRDKRLGEMMKLLAQKKSLNWKYQQ